MIEEAYEAAEAMDADDSKEICDELGDVLLQVVLNAQVAKDAKNFNIADVIYSIDSKMKRRHPHVFGSEDEKKDREIHQIKLKWQEIKQAEKSNTAENDISIFEKEKILKVHPSTRKAYEIGKIAKKIRFDWDGYEPVFEKLKSEVEELSQELGKKKNSDNIYSELGDVYFTLAQLCRHLGYDPELVAEDGNRKFLDRFSRMERLIDQGGFKVEKLNQNQLEDYWEKTKELEKIEEQ